ncbi:MAG: ABC transporter ATP-binding protein [Clostridiales bacterium]|nr:ABC transporter ATP-binding protein [Clostridiales bacterium]
MKNLIWTIKIAWKTQAVFLALILIGYSLLYLLEPLSSLLIKQLINGLEEQQMLSKTMIFGMILLYFLISLQNIQYSFSMVFIEKIENDLSCVIQNYFFKAIEKVNLIQFDRSEFLEKLYRSKNMSWYGMSNLLNEIFHMIAQIIGLIATAYLIGKESILFFLLFLGVSFIGHFMDKWYMEEAIENQKKLDKMDRKITYLFELLSEKKSVKELKVGKWFSWILKKWENENEQQFESKIGFTKKWNKKYFALGSAVSLFDKLVLVGLAYSVMESHTTLGAFFLIYNSKDSFINGINSLFQSWASIKEQEVYIRELRELLKQEDSLWWKELQEELVSLENISFSYPNRQEVIKDVSCTIQKGEVVAIVGENGSGKSTLAKIILGLLQPTKGEVKKRKERINRVYQDFVRYELSLKENIVFGDLEEKERRDLLEKAIIKGGASHTYEQVKRDENTILGKLFDENGIELSGGEWQKIAVSRGFFGKNPFIIFDEPSASLDPIAEVKQFKSIKEDLREGGGIIITHRIGLAKNADRILFMQKGELVEQGTHKELIEKKGEYAKFFEMQAKWYQ